MPDNTGNPIIDLIGGLVGMIGGSDGPSRQQIIADAMSDLLNQQDIVDDANLDTEAAIASLLGGAVDGITDLSDQAEYSIQHLLGLGTNAIRGTQDAARLTIRDESQNAIGAIADFAGNLFGSLDNGLGDAIGIVTGLFGDTNSLIQDLLRGNSTFIEILTARAGNALEDIVREHSEVLEAVFGDIGESIVPLISDAAENNAAVSSAVIDALNAEVAQSQANAETINENLADSIQAITGESESALSTTREALVESGEAQTVATTEGASAVAGSITESVGRLTDNLGQFSDSFSADAAVVNTESVRETIKSVLDKLDCAKEYRDIIDGFIDEILGNFSVMGATAQMMMIPGIAKTVLDPVLAVAGNCLAQAAARITPTSLPSPSELVDQYRRGIVDDRTAISEMLSQGYNLDRASRYLDQSEEKPQLGLITTWWLRGFTSTDDAVRQLHELGYSPDSIEHILRMSFFIPPVQDLITMAVREVFNPDIAQAFGQFDDYPDEFTGYAGQQGISEEWARRYWAAHWALPSPQQGFEMLHRRVPGTDQKIISPEELNLLLRALDIMPFWRDKLTNIAYRPITRVDIRRMASLGLISYEEVQKRYEDIGFAPPDAELMTEFTRHYNKDVPAADGDELEGITRSMIVKLFKQGALSRSEASDALVELGHTQLASNVILESVAIDLEVDERTERTQLVIEQAKAGMITFSQAYDQLSALGLEPVELSRAQVKLEREQARQTKLPSLSQVTKMMQHDIISNAEYLITLERMGYSLIWAERLRQLADKE